MTKPRWALAALCLAVCALIMTAARAEEAPDITGLADIRLSKRNSELPVITDGDYRTEWEAHDDGYIEFTLPDAHPCHTLYALTGGEPDRVVIEEEVDGRWVRLPMEGERFNIQCLPLGGKTHFRLTVTRGPLRVMEVRLYGEGTLPADAVDYHLTTDKADLMILACHPDDDVLWLGGLMPTYAGQLGMNVQMVYMTDRFHYRRCEAMDALWHCGVRHGPVFVGLKDYGKISYTEAVKAWGGIRAVARMIARIIRQYRPEVLVTQDVNGEYGHVQHRIMVAACTQAIRLAADPGERTLRSLPAWEVKKYYIHLFEDGALVLDMERPLSAFGGKSAFQVAQEAFLLHKSQQTGRYEVAVDGPYDIRRFGLAYSAVGPDEAHDGLFEHLDALYALEKTLSEAP